MQTMLGAWQAWLWSGAGLLGTVLLTLLAHRLLFSLVLAPLRRPSRIVDLLCRHTHQPTRVILPLLAVLLVLPALPLTTEARVLVKHGVDLGLIGSVGWLLVRLSGVAADLIIGQYQHSSRDDLTLRTARTRVEVLQRIASVVIAVITVALMLMTFPSIQHLGLSLLASAGFAGLVLGIAAQPTLANLIAGLQIALTQPIRINDVVIAEGEWGWIEEIGMTYVVVRVWDQRRLVIPLRDFIERPFQNWTRKTADLLGTVYIYADYSVPVDEVRQELHRVLAASELWDGRAWALQVTDANERAVQLRALMSAPDSSTAWELRCHVRERLIAFLRDHYPDSLPRLRAEARPAEHVALAAQAAGGDRQPGAG